MRRIALILFVLLSILLISRCAVLDQLATVQKPNVNVKDVKVTGLSFQDIDLNVVMNIDNPNGFGVKLASYDYSLSSQNTEIMSGTEPSGLQIMANGQQSVSVPVNLKFQKLYDLYSSIKNQDSTALQFEAGLGFELPVIGPIRVPLRKEFHVPVIKLPKIKVGQLKLSKLSLTSADLDLVLQVENNNYFDLLMKNLNFDLNVNGLEWAKGNLAAAKTMSSNENTEYHIPFSLNLFTMGTTVLQILKGNSDLDYKFNADADFGSTLPMLKELSLPINTSGKVQLSK